MEIKNVNAINKIIAELSARDYQAQAEKLTKAMDENEQYLTLCELLDGAIGLSDAELKKVCL